MSSPSDGADAVVASLTPTAKLLYLALKASGGTEHVLKFSNVLRRWAREGRPYRGHSFGEHDVDAASKTLLASCGHNENTADITSTVDGAAQKAPRNEAKHSAVDARPSSLAPNPQPDVSSKVVPHKIQGVYLQATESWPPEHLRETCRKLISSLGSSPGSLPSNIGSFPFLQALHAKLGEGEFGDINVLAQGASDRSVVKLPAHRSILAAVSDLAACSFDGRFKSENELNATDFSSNVVASAIQFAYLGQCCIPESELISIFTFADLWQWSSLKKSVEPYLGKIPAAKCLRYLSETLPPKLAAALATRAANGFLNMGSKFSQAVAPVDLMRQLDDREPRSSLDEEALANTSLSRSIASAYNIYLATRREKLAEQARLASAAAHQAEANNKLGWLFAQQLQDTVSSMPKEAIAQLVQDYVLGESGGLTGPLAEPMELFFFKALRVVTRAGCDAKLQLLGALRNLLLPIELDLQIAMRLRDERGLADECGNLLPWVDWVCDGTRDFAQLWCLYRAIGRRREPADASELSNGRHLQPDNDHLVWSIEKAFAGAFANSFGRDEDAAAQLDNLLGHGTNIDPVLIDAFHILAKVLRRNRRALGKMPPAAVLWILVEAVSSLPSTVVKISGPETIAGIYKEIPSGKGMVSERFLRESGSKNPSGNGTDLELLRVARESNLVRINWKGVPPALLKSAKTEWKVQRRGTDAEVDLPFAVSLDDAKDPTRIRQTWWLCSGKREQFKQCLDIVVTREKAVLEEVTPLATAVNCWVRNGGSLDALRGLASSADEGRNFVSQRSIVLQVCDEASALANIPIESTQEDVSDFTMLGVQPPPVENPSGHIENVRGMGSQSTSSFPPAEKIVPKPRDVDAKGQESKPSSSTPSLVESASHSSKKVHSITPEACDRLAKISRVTHPLEEAQRRWETAAEAARQAAAECDAAFKAWEAAKEAAARAHELELTERRALEAVKELQRSSSKPALPPSECGGA